MDQFVNDLHIDFAFKAFCNDLQIDLFTTICFVALRSSWFLVYLSNRPRFPWVCRRGGPRGVLGEYGRACKSRAEGEWFAGFFSVLPASQVVCRAGEPIEGVLYCFYKITMSLPAQ